MRLSGTLAVAFGLALAAGIPQNVFAQEREEHQEGEHRDRDKRENRDRDDREHRDRDERDNKNYNNNRSYQAAPEFCRNGQGHPQFGREWCVDHNFPVGNQWSPTYQQQQAAIEQARRQRAWEQRNDWNDVRMTSPRQRSIATVGTTQLWQILGANGTRRLQQQAQALGSTQPLIGRWMRDTSGHAVLLVSSGGLQIAQIVDTNGDGQVDRVFLLHP